ncbi:peptide-methionine (S)-S-oxide reductase MsrA [Flavihumibacter rivuli]|uniref:peptide-methionine (S)-S-oxide reductase MsrA n=1 Tax=Flavihumibacter rivuli TaxID=2838156 RepID=UPI001BDF2963|nr:peptide-methionine (S)-S-oxide reductase MsrA [Flavihumibacter rivuli]ULQ57920.1 peptide-methionine (S)-S-oxide reductase MsrA [Flavihumibacter rivuli]
MKIYFYLSILSVTHLLFSCAQKENPNKSMTNDLIYASNLERTDTATLGAGCFWCVEAVFQQLNGVLKVTSGYSGGTVANPTYEQVCEKNTGHAEVIQVVFDPAIISFDELLEVFWQTHDPTTPNQQGNDVGPQYRSAIFYHNEEQRQKAIYYKTELDKSGAWKSPIITEISPLKNFYVAEDYHQKYYQNNASQPYCYFVIRPKLEKFEKVFKDKLKKNNQAEARKQ